MPSRHESKSYQKIWSDCYWQAFRICKNHADAEEVAQSVMTKFLVQPKPVTNGWYACVTKNMCRDILRKRRAQRTTEYPVAQLLDRNVLVPSDHDEEVNRIMSRVLDSIPPSRRELFGYWLEGLTMAQMAAKLGKSESNTKMTLSRLLNDYARPVFAEIALVELMTQAKSCLNMLEEYELISNYVEHHGLAGLDAIRSSSLLRTVHTGFVVKCYQVADNYLADNWRSINSNSRQRAFNMEAIKLASCSLDPRSIYVTYATHASNTYKLIELNQGSFVEVVECLKDGLNYGPFSQKVNFQSLHQSVQDSAFTAFAIGTCLDARIARGLPDWNRSFHVFKAYKPKSNIAYLFHQQLCDIDLHDRVSLANVNIPSLSEFEWSMKEILSKDSCREMYRNRVDVTSPHSTGLNRY